MSETPNIETRTSAGTHLKNLREEKGLSIAEVSTRLYLQAHIIEALERGDHDSIPTGTYVHGYLQNYAKLLDTPADLVLAMYKEDITEQPEQIPQRQPEPKAEQTGEWPFTILYIVIFISILLPFTWWRSQYLDPAALGVADGRIRGNSAYNAGFQYTFPIIEHPDNPFYRAPNTEPLTSGSQAQDPDKKFETATATYNENTITKGIGPDRVRVVLTEDCWIEIFGADNEKVFYDLARPGQILVLNGTAPFKVLLGNSAAATVEFNNLLFDTTPYRSRIGMARFVLGEDQ